MFTGVLIPFLIEPDYKLKDNLLIYFYLFVFSADPLIFFIFFISFGADDDLL